MMCVFYAGVTEDPKPKRRFNNTMKTEQEYFACDVDQLIDFRCPKCKSHSLFRGCVYIGCNNCMNYFDEKEIIEYNL